MSKRNPEPDRVEFQQKSNNQGECAEDLKYEAVVVVCSTTDPFNNQICEPDARAHVDVVRFLVEFFEAADLSVQVLEGMGYKVFIKVAATEMVTGRAAEALRLKKLTTLGNFATTVQ